MMRWPALLDTPRHARLRRRWGWPALVGGLCLSVTAWLHGVSLPAQREQLQAAQADVAQALRSAEARRPRAVVAAESPSARFRAQFPPAAERHVRLAALVALARVDGVALQRVESRWLPGEPLARYEVTMPLQGEYARIRAFIVDALGSDSSLSLDGVRLRRANVDTSALDGELHWALHSRNDEASGVGSAASGATVP